MIEDEVLPSFDGVDIAEDDNEAGPELTFREANAAGFSGDNSGAERGGTRRGQRQWIGTNIMLTSGYYSRRSCQRPWAPTGHPLPNP